MTDEDAVAHGHLIREAFAAADEHLKPDVIEIVDPRDGTRAPFSAANGRLDPVTPAAFDPWRKVPVARTGIARLTTLPSFIAHVGRFAQANSAIFACDDMDKARLTAIFDYHPAIVDGQEAAPMAGKHRAEYAFPLSDEWKAWHGADGEQMDMAKFAAFMEERIIEVVSDPKPSGDAAKDFVQRVGGKMATPSKLIELSRGLQVYENSVLKEARKLSSGEAQLTFESSHTDADGKPLDVPRLFMIEIPIFARAADVYRLIARLSYRKTNAGLVFWFELWRADLAFEQAFTEACTKVETETGLPLFVGSAEY